MSAPEAGKPAITARLLAEARRAAAGEAFTPIALIEAQDRDLARALKRADEEERVGLLRLLQKLGARGKRVAERALTDGGLPDATLAALAEMLGERQPPHPVAEAYRQLSAQLEQGDVAAAARSLASLPEPLLGVWARREGERLLAAPESTLRALLETDRGPAVIEAFGVGLPAAALEQLAGVARTSPQRALIKAIRALFFRLSQRGVTVPSLESRTPLAAEAQRALASDAWISRTDVDGEQAIWILEELPEGRWSVLQATLNDRGTLEASDAFFLPRRRVEELREKLSQKFESGVVSLGLAEAMGIVEDAYVRNPVAASRDYRAWRQTAQADRRALRPTPTELDAAAAELAAESSQLLRHEELVPWVLNRAEAEAAERVLLEATHSELVLPAEEQARRRQEGLRRAMASVPGSWRRRLAGRLESTARYCRAAGENRLAQLAAGTARHLLEDKDAAPPLLQHIVERSLDLLRQLRERQAAAGEEKAGERGEGGG